LVSPSVRKTASRSVMVMWENREVLRGPLGAEAVKPEAHFIPYSIQQLRVLVRNWCANRRGWCDNGRFG
jgi:hypothetical protein